jgi:hypothetical protein
MRGSLSFLLALSFMSLSVQAQITSVKESSATQSGSLGNTWQEAIENHGSSSIVALRTAFRCLLKSKRKQKFALQGIVVNVRDALGESYSRSVRPIPPGGAVDLSAQDPSQCSGGVDAVIFSDGHSEGDPDSVSALYQRRRGIYSGLTEALQLLDTIANHGANPKDVADIASRRSDSVGRDQTVDIEERMGQRQLYTRLESLLRSQMDMGVPSDSTPYRQPSIEEVAKANGIPREQAHAIVISKKFQEWKADLEGNLEPLAAK